MKFQRPSFLILFLVFFQITEAQEIDKPNFIFYLADDQDQLDYGAYGNPNVHTPAVDQLASEGMLFNKVYAGQSVCAPSRSQIFTGLYAMENGCVANHLPVKSDVLSITDFLKSAGYEVVLAGKSHVKPNSVFDWSEYFPSIDHRYLPMTSIDTYLENVNSPFCLIIASDFPHGPYPSDTDYTKEDIYQLPYNGSWVANFKPGYYQNIKDDNGQLEQVLEMVDNHGLKNNTLFAYAADHGITGKYSVSEPGLRVPLVIRWPGNITPQSTSETLLSLIDVLPTFLDIAGANVPEGLDGKSFYNTLKGNSEIVHEYVYGISTRQNIQKCTVFPSRMIRGQKFKFIRNYNSVDVVASNLGENSYINAFIEIGANSFPTVPYEELYNLDEDPYEQNNLISEPTHQNKKEELAKALDNWMLDQNDFLVTYKMPLLFPTLHPLDINSQWNLVSNELEGTLSENDYIPLHYNSVLGVSDFNAAEYPSLFSIFKNPITEELPLVFSSAGSYQVTLFNLSGQQLLQVDYDNVDSATIDTRFLERGVYIVSSYSKDTKQFSTIKFIKT